MASAGSSGGAGRVSREAQALRVVGSYRLERRLGSGAMGEVWLGRHVLTGGAGAVKLLREGGRNPERLRQFFLREGRAVARLRHPHIVGVFEIGSEHLVIQFIDGSDLARRLHTPVDPALALRLTRQIASALAHAHASGVVHRDVKPSNILVDKQHNAYLADFGLALLADEDAVDTARAGTPGFMPPEQQKVGAARVGPAADQFALGRTLLEMLVGGRLPQDGAEALALYPAHLPEPLRAAIERATAATPEERFPSMEAFDAALARLDLSAYAAPVRLAPEVRTRTPFAWAGGAHQVAMLAPDLMRADFRLGDLRKAGVLPAAAIDALLAKTGLTDVGWSMYGCSTRLGPLDEAGALARATEVVVLLHGWAATRKVWANVAVAICRDNAQAVVITPDSYGFGETRFVARPTQTQLGARGVLDMVAGWLELLHLNEFPTVLVGHSMTAVSVLMGDDESIGPRISRIAVNPVFPQYFPEYRTGVRRTDVLVNTLGRITPLRRWFAYRQAHHSAASVELAPSVRNDFAENFLTIAPNVAAGMFRALYEAPPLEPGAGQQRLLVVLGANDALITEASIAAAVAALGLHETQLVHLATGGHYPHLEAEAHPEWTARNAAELVGLVATMMHSSREGTVLSTQLQSTIAGDTGEASTGQAISAPGAATPLPGSTGVTGSGSSAAATDEGLPPHSGVRYS
jgi:pimeloyl-ACP methyl ester carboxylesterase